jgi:hypothetical protein
MQTRVFEYPPDNRSVGPKSAQGIPKTIFVSTLTPKVPGCTTKYSWRSSRKHTEVVLIFCLSDCFLSLNQSRDAFQPQTYLALLFLNELCVAVCPTRFALDDLVDPVGSLRIMEDRIVGAPSTIYIDPKIDPLSKCVGTGKILTTLEFVMFNQVVGG